ncbi:tRNA (5-methylaminomethyl-2-thiouridine)(34)-methyltransferase MnmD [Cloacibacterium rupense]|uniref:tRNA (5-methylaminomethyl-2-thiouridine)(34)-methyltransferase MnmD n=1 Tax=Cloacibacterium rupense TaxID=517423 RepID=UPI0016670222|nr:tRNA (5-methylaminomethyl-2-thiouridine)(34)-methyltransferase MnmD [Cloacibacterium rupense]
MKREIKTTLDGSKTLFINELNEGYHSHNGALQEAEHVFIKNGINNIKNYEINILELGFGTGLNALVTINEYLKNDKSHKINYFTLEKYPVTEGEIVELSYVKHFNFENSEKIYHEIHTLEWGKTHSILPNFSFTKFECDFFNLENLDLPPIDLVYYDCFGAKVQPDLWEKPLFEMVKNKMRIGGLLTTYSSKGSVRRILKELNFEVTKLEGPKGKREMINAVLLNEGC